MKSLQFTYLLIGVFIVLAFSDSIQLYGQNMCDVKSFQLNKIKGKVVSDGPNGTEPIEKAKIELRKINKHTKDSLVSTFYTDKDGNFEVNKIKDGKYSISVSKRELKFFDYYFTVKKIKSSSEAETSLIIRLGVSPIEPCGGGFVKLKEE